MRPAGVPGKWVEFCACRLIVVRHRTACDHAPMPWPRMQIDDLSRSEPTDDRITDALVIFRSGPAHSSLGKEYGQPYPRSVVLHAAIASEDRRENEIGDLQVRFYG